MHVKHASLVHVALPRCICLPSAAQAAFLASFRERADALSAEADAQKAAHKEVRMLGAAACLGAGTLLVCSMQWRMWWHTAAGRWQRALLSPC